MQLLLFYLYFTDVANDYIIFIREHNDSKGMNYLCQII